MDDAELTRLAAEQLIREAKKFTDRRDAEFRATQMKQPLKTNKRFLNNTIKNVMSFNNNRNNSKKIIPKKCTVNINSKLKHPFKKRIDNSPKVHKEDNDSNKNIESSEKLQLKNYNGATK